jgi:hypothetical protein
MRLSPTTGQAAIAELLASYPRRRPPLPPDNALVYLEEYKINRNATGRPLYRLVAGLESWMHRQIAACPLGTDLLELGAGTLNHRPYESAAINYDIVEPLDELYRGNPSLRQIRRIYAAISDVAPDRRYHRIVSIAVLEHLENLPTIVANSALLLCQDGVLQAGIPAEGGLLWGLSWRLTTGLVYRMRTGTSYRPLMRHEHLNSAPEILKVLRHFFDDVDIRWFPGPHLHSSFYAYLEARRPRLDVCREWLAGAMSASSASAAVQGGG